MTVAERIEAYAQHYLRRFRSEVTTIEASLQAARKRLAIAEQEYKNGKMVTGNEDNIPTLLRGIL
jgi:hypothetical protein